MHGIMHIFSQLISLFCTVKNKKNKGGHYMGPRTLKRPIRCSLDSHDVSDWRDASFLWLIVAFFLGGGENIAYFASPGLKNKNALVPIQHSYTGVRSSQTVWEWSF